MYTWITIHDHSLVRAPTGTLELPRTKNVDYGNVNSGVFETRNKLKVKKNTSCHVNLNDNPARSCETGISRRITGLQKAAPAGWQ
jgi:hypothetical protein